MSDNPTFQVKCLVWLEKNTKKLSLALLSMFLMTFVLYYSLEKGRNRSFNKSLLAEQLFNKWSKTLNAGKDAQFSQLISILHALPSLQSKYYPLIAQKLLQSHSLSSDRPIAEMALKKISKDLPYHAEFAQISLLLEKNEYSQALQSSQLLKQSMDGDHDFWTKRSQDSDYGHVLYSFNLLRIAMLSRKEGSLQGEFLAWDKIEADAGWKDANQQVDKHRHLAYVAMEQNFNRQILLRDYAKYRKNHLMQAGGAR